MARPRSKKNAWMPPHVERYKGGYRWNRRNCGTKHLAPSDATQAEVWAAYERHFSTLPDDTLSTVIDAYFKSPQFFELKPGTQKDYQYRAPKIREVFGAMKPDTITSPHVQLFMDARGSVHKSAANQEKAFLSMIFNWGKARGYIGIENPVTSVRRVKTTAGGRYVEDWEYEALYKFMPPMFQSAMEIAYLCASRRQDVVALKREHMKDDGLLIVQGKTNKAQLKLWTPRLRQAVDQALSIKHRIDSMAIIRNESGQPYTVSGFSTMWGKLMDRAIEKGVIESRFRFHDLKVKAISDYVGDKQNFSGHKTRSMVERYNRTADKVAVLDKVRK